MALPSFCSKSPRVCSQAAHKPRPENGLPKTPVSARSQSYFLKEPSSRRRWPILAFSLQSVVYANDHGHVAPEVITGNAKLGIAHMRVELADPIQIVFIVFDHARRVNDDPGAGKELDKVSTTGSSELNPAQVFPPSQIVYFCYSTLATIKAAVQTAARHGRSP